MVRHVVACVLLASCTESTPELGVIAKGGECEEFICGNTNSPEIDQLGLHELNLAYPSYEPEPRNHFRIKAFMKGNDEYIPQLVAGVLTGRQVLDPTHVIAGAGLVGARFIVETDLSSKNYVLEIEEVGDVPYWAATGGLQTPYYRINWAIEGGGEPLANICKNTKVEQGAETLNMMSYAIVLFEGDRIDAKSKSVVDVDKMWMNLGCAGHAVSKLHLTAHSHAAQLATGKDTTLDERTTMLKMFAADYCGTGQPFTIAGQPLSWIDDHHWLSLWPGPVYEIEARWTPKGAACLNTPRLLQNPSPEAEQLFPALKDDIAAACGGELPPPCTGGFGTFDGAHLISANPIP